MKPRIAAKIAKLAQLLGLRPFIAGGSEAGAARRNALGLSIIDRPQEC